jgi:GTP cyclohydrolase III
MEKSSHAATCAELGKTPMDATKNAGMSTQTSHRCDRKMREDDNEQRMYHDPMPRQGESSDDGVAQGGPSDIEDLRSPRGE